MPKVNVLAVRPQTFFERWKPSVKEGIWRLFISTMTLFFALGMGLLSFAGLIELVPLVALGLASFVFTAAIIGSVYQGSIRQGIERLFTRRYTAREQCRDALIAHYDNCRQKGEVEDRIKRYLQQYWNLRALQSKHALTSAEEKKKISLSKACQAEELHWLRETSVYDKSGNTKARLSNTIRSAVRWQQYGVSPFAFVCAALAGVSMFAVIAGVAVGGEGAILSVLALFGVNVATSAAVTAAMASGLGIAALAAIPYMFAIYHTLMKLFNHQRVLAWKKSVSNYVRNKQISPWKRGALVVVVVLTIALTVTATVFTAGGWWQAAATGAKVFAFVGVHAQSILEAFALVTVPFYAFAFFAFSVTHSVQAMSRFVKQAKNPIRVLREAFVAYREKHGWAQTFNPVVLVMLLLSVPLKIMIFLLHNISEALVNVKEGGSQGVLGVIFISADDMATEANEVFHEHVHMHKLPDEASIDSLGFSPRKSLRDALDEHEGGCNHGPLDMLVYIIQIPVLLFLHPLAALWDCTVGNCSRDGDAKKDFFEALADSWNWLHQKLCLVVAKQMLHREDVKLQREVGELKIKVDKLQQQVDVDEGDPFSLRAARSQSVKKAKNIADLQAISVEFASKTTELNKTQAEKTNVRFFKVLWFGAGGSVCAPASTQLCC